jgi:hypothetical protein
MAVNKNFVVKNGVEVSTNLIYAESSIDKVGIGTTTPGAKLEVIGNIVGVGLTLSGSTTGTNANYSGIVTSSTGLEVGAGGTSITVDVTNNSTGFNSTTPDTNYVLDVQPGAGQSAANFGGGVDITGNLSVTGAISGTIQTLNNPTITGVVTANDAEIYTQFDIINNSTVAYQYQTTGIGFTQNADNPVLYLVRGKKYHFNLNASGHPFYIKKPEAGIGSVGVSLLYQDGVEGQGTQVGILTFKVPFNAPSNVYYQCSIHAGMGNTMYLLDGTGTGGGGAAGGISSIAVYSADTLVGNTTSLNFDGINQTVTVDGDKIDISIKGQTSTGIGSPISYSDGESSPFAYIDAESNVRENMVLDTTNAGPGTSYVVVASPKLVIQSGVGVTLGLGKTMVIDILNLGEIQ